MMKIISEQILGNNVSKHAHILNKKNFAYTISTMTPEIKKEYQIVFVSMLARPRGPAHHFCAAH